MRSRALFSLGAGVPLGAYILTSSAHTYWFDSGEFSAAGINLGVSHPPGHPLAALVIRLVDLLPLGSLCLRAALASAVMLSVATGFAALSGARIARLAGVTDRWVSGLLGLTTGWSLGAFLGVWFQGVRPEVYALEAAVVAIVVERLSALLESPSDARPFLHAALAFGLGLANHHLLTLLLLPLLLPPVVKLWRSTGLRALLPATTLTALGLATYVYLPLRAMAGPSPNLGDPQTIERFGWVVSAQVFQKNTGSGVPKAFSDRAVDVAGVLTDDVPFVALVAAAVALWVGFRLARTRGVTLLAAALLFITVAVRSWLGFVNGNPDASGYLFGAYLAVALLGTVTTGFVGHLLGQGLRPRLVAGALALLSTWLYFDNHAKASLAHFSSTDLFDDDLRRNLPPRALVILYGPQTMFRAWGGEAAEQTRPDITFVPMPFLGYPGASEALQRQEPEIRDFLLTFFYSGELTEAELQGLSARRPVFLELDVDVDPDLYATLVPNGVLYEVLSESAYAGDRRVGSLVHDGWVSRLYRLLAEAPTDPATREQLLWKNYLDALYFAAIGDAERAQKATRRGLDLNDQSRELRALDEALRNLTPGNSGGILDARQFFPR